MFPIRSDPLETWKAPGPMLVATRWSHHAGKRQVSSGFQVLRCIERANWDCPNVANQAAPASTSASRAAPG